MTYAFLLVWLAPIIALLGGYLGECYDEWRAPDPYATTHDPPMPGDGADLDIHLLNRTDYSPIIEHSTDHD